MKRTIIIALAISLLPLHSMAQDDMYFVPTKKNKQKAREEYLSTVYANYSNNTRDVNEYNRRSQQVSTVQLVDSAGNDIIVFDAVAGVYPDSVVAEMYRSDSLMSAATDYQYTKQLSRFDDYQWRQAYNEGYSDGRYDSWGSTWYYDPWYWNSWYYDNWNFYGWHYPWHYSWHYSWHRPYHWHHAWHRPHYGYRPPHGTTIRPANGVTGTRNRGTFSNNRNSSSSRNNSSFSNSSRRNSSFNSGSFGSSRGSSFTSGSSGGSRGGSFSGGSRGGGGSSRGGGSFGGRR